MKKASPSILNFVLFNLHLPQLFLGCDGKIIVLVLVLIHVVSMLPSNSLLVCGSPFAIATNGIQIGTLRRAPIFECSAFLLLSNFFIPLNPTPSYCSLMSFLFVLSSPMHNLPTLVLGFKGIGPY